MPLVTCKPGGGGADRDMTQAALDLMAVIGAVAGHATVAQVVDVFRGAKNAAVRKHGHERLPCWGAGSGLGCGRRFAPWPHLTLSDFLLLWRGNCYQEVPRLQVCWSLPHWFLAQLQGRLLRSS